MLAALISLTPLDILILSVGCLGLLKKVADMDRFHELRVAVLTLALSLIVIYIFAVYCFTLGNPNVYPDGACESDPHAFCITE